ncbi:hAT family dimerization protein [Rhizoctonia solani AG-3 Rhs1AP]|uniref:HAT family dimerization protein n=1 Tax=Rhizoctonia solani AG-3 Rhs1AP TaxID=1086054 RepID=X8J005_9AGAM|nr:hAT family dimerization protein [Rhizoctonia solani AG-3 Rhs1AP]
MENLIEIVLDEDEDARDHDSDAEDNTELLGDMVIDYYGSSTNWQFARNVLKLAISDSMLALARGVLSKAASLARKLHDSPTLQAKFKGLIEASLSQLKTDRRALARRVPTRWNSDYECLLSLLELRPCVEMLTADSENNLQHLALNTEQWEILEQLIWVLKIFKEVSDLCTRANEPLVHQVIPMFVRIRCHLEAVRKDEKGKLHPLIRAAAHSALLVDNKYMDAFADSEVHWIALVMCPDLKLQWLQDNGFSASQIDTIYQVIVNRFNSTYKNSSSVNSATIDQQQEEESEDEWIPNNRPLRQSADVNSIETYLRTEHVSRHVIKLAGGPLQYWDAQRALVSCSDLSRFAIDYLSAPASSVEVERAFSCGHLMTNHLQHQMSPETFQAKMALRSWYKTPLLWDVSELATVLGDSVKDLVSESPNAHDQSHQ